MAFRIKNISHQLLIVSLNSGKTVYLAPRESSHPIEELEISGNEKVAKLLKANLVATTKVETAKKLEEKAGKKREAVPKRTPEAESEKKPKRRDTRKKGSD